MCIQSENYGDFRRMCNPRHNYVHFTGGKLRHGDSPHFLWWKHLQCNDFFEIYNFFLAQNLTILEYANYGKFYQAGSKGSYVLSPLLICSLLNIEWSDGPMGN